MFKRVAILDANRCVGCQICMLVCSERLGYAGLTKSAIWVVTPGGVERGFTVIVCRACKDPPCARACPEDALKIRPVGGVLLDPRKCIGCGHCVAACDIGAIRLDPETGKPIICVYCGYCTQFCPHHVIALEEVV
ncbi:MAG: 4Fe-4S binding protein [Aigarchaeota archaeon]|nr:4Fe-4S binding protein [Aigarchaeota archaeon]MDW8021983.1 4Fe-4S binding protein [Nitrososphaerota archaeon]